jgi:transposase
VLQYHFNWKVLSAAAGITWWNFYFRLYPGTIHATEVIDFLGHLLRHLPGKLLVVWDGLPQHRARLVTEFIRAQRGRLTIEWLPGYAPELNPVEYIWGYWKHHELPNFCPPRLRSAQLSGPQRAAPHAAAPTTSSKLLATGPTFYVTILCKCQWARKIATNSRARPTSSSARHHALKKYQSRGPFQWAVLRIAWPGARLEQPSAKSSWRANQGLFLDAESSIKVSILKLLPSWVDTPSTKAGQLQAI